ncbi:hypothetical protein ABEB36_008517 [Hypothenemus hampei]|uniref:DNA helicase MCM9 n=1 Tax=Hypothenemus hampei TaxID=57062 RepID=A0ABD1EM56_HYPHA
MCEDYLVSYHKIDIIAILEHEDTQKHYSVYLNFLDLFESDVSLGNSILTDPETSFITWNKAIHTVQINFLEDSKKYTIKSNIHCRIYNLPSWPHICRTIFPGNEDVNKFLQITGVVTRTSAKKLLEFQRNYTCKKCKFSVLVEAVYDKNNIIKKPKKCSNPVGCRGTMITSGNLDSSSCKDYQEIKIQEDLSQLSSGTLPNHLKVTLEDDLVNSCKPGENITITGIIKRRWSEFDKGVKTVIEIVLRANHIQVNNSSSNSIKISDDAKEIFKKFWLEHKNDPLAGRNVILKSIAPEIYGLNLVKLTVGIVLAGGSQTPDNEDSTGVDVRSESHLLLVGDPGTGKSEMLRFASKIIPRSVLTTGGGSTAAGLTVTAIMENGEWQLEAGALVMADGGICCIDEFNSMKEADRVSIHEAMEQQTISVAKAGIVCKLKSRCSILASCNPKGNVDTSLPLCINVAMSSPLLSRFDIILLLKDVVNRKKDAELASYLINKDQLTDNKELWNLKKLQLYFAYIRKMNPEITTDAKTILSHYYQLQRRSGGQNKSRITVRLLESLIRLAQGHAKLMCHREVTILDALFAVILVDITMDQDNSILNLQLDSDPFCDDSEGLGKEIFEKVLVKLKLNHLYENGENISETDTFLFSYKSERHSTLYSHCDSKTIGNETLTTEVKGTNKEVSINSPIETYELFKNNYQNCDIETDRDHGLKESTFIQLNIEEFKCETVTNLSHIITNESIQDNFTEYDDLPQKNPFTLERHCLQQCRINNEETVKENMPENVVEINNVECSMKRKSKHFLPKKASKKRKKMNDMLKLMPSVNDDILDMNLDWELEETVQLNDQFKHISDANSTSLKESFVNTDECVKEQSVFESELNTTSRFSTDKNSSTQTTRSYNFKNDGKNQEISIDLDADINNIVDVIVNPFSKKRSTNF